jgi:hypothetical protein
MDAGTMMLIGQGVQTGSRIAGGMAANRAGEYNAAALERQGTDERAAAQRVAMERRAETDRVISKQIAGAAASGAGFGPSLLDVIGDTAARGEYLAQGDMYQGETRARGLKDRANIARYEGRNAFVGSILEGVGGLAIGAGRYANAYGSPTKTTPIGPWRTTVSYG